MNAQERFQRTMRYRGVDRAPMVEVGAWRETLDRWRTEGMPANAGVDQAIMFNGCPFFGLDEQRCTGLNLGMIPGFESERIAEDERTATCRTAEGVVVRGMKDSSSMPQYLSWPVRERKDFAQMRGRYDPDLPERRPADWTQLVAWSKTRQCPLWAPGIGSIGFYSQLRRWMGTENACTVFYDDPAFAHEMLDFTADFAIGVFGKALREAPPDFFLWWEDFSFKNGPLVSPAIFREFLLPRYRRVNDTLHRLGIDIIFLDTDGDPTVLLGLLLESGVNGTYPLEAAAGMDPVALRREFGRDLLLWGGIDKRALARDRAAIDEELQYKIPALVAEGGYIPQLDHLAPPDVPYQNWLYYLELKRKLLETG